MVVFRGDDDAVSHTPAGFQRAMPAMQKKHDSTNTGLHALALS